ncbi:Ig-like domain-containing protein, partial [Flavobacterium chungangense]|uniref:Ig-like domain-containing protein n=1 Tax=Flavobacterium chungangense TaxID=554283 RepID=UPI0015DFDED1
SDLSGLATAQAAAPIATDNCGATVTYTKTSGSFMAGSCINSGTYTNTWEAKDICLNTSTIFTQIITIQDTTAPMWTTVANDLNVTLECSDLSGLATAQAAAPIATDNCGGTVTYTKTSGSFVAGSCINSGTYTNTWEAKDICLNTSTIFTQTITIQDTTAPMWTTAAASLNVTLQCSDLSRLATAQAAAPIATDNCGGTVTYNKISGSFMAGSCINSGTYTNTWEAKDICLNTSTIFTQIITIQDTTAPMWTTVANDLNVTLECSDLSGLANAQTAAPVATDNCGGTVTYTKISGSFIADSCINSGTYTNTWVAKDVCNNSSTTFTQVITIQDTTAPTWTTAAASLDVTLQCSDLSGLATAQAAAPIATDNCGGTVTYTKTSGSFVAGSCINSGTYTNTWEAKDIC